MSTSAAAPIAPAAAAAPLSNLRALAKAAQAAKEAEAKPQQDRELHLLTSLAEYIAAQAIKYSVPAAERGYGWTKCFDCHLPTKSRVEFEGETVLRPDFPPESTHWSGPDSDPSQNGVPIVLLLQGPRGKDGKVRPWQLAGGKTAVELAQDILKTKDADLRLECRFNGMNKTIDVTAIWIEEDWKRFLSKRDNFRRDQQRPQTSRDDRPRAPRDERPRDERPVDSRPRPRRPAPL